jgi:hypothetical protein
LSNDSAATTATERAELEAAIVHAVTSAVTDVMDGDWGEREWLHLFVDIEVAADGDRSSSIAFAFARLPGQAVEKVAFRLPHEARRLFRRLADAMEMSSSGRWNSARLRLSRDGRYTLEFSYDPPWRLGGNLIDDRFDGALEQWLASDEGAPHRAQVKRWWQGLLGA